MSQTSLSGSLLGTWGWDQDAGAPPRRYRIRQVLRCSRAAVQARLSRDVQRRRKVTVAKTEKREQVKLNSPSKPETVGVIQALKISALSVGFNVGDMQSFAPLNLPKHAQKQRHEPHVFTRSAKRA